MGGIRYVLFAAVGIVVATVLFFVLSWLIGPHFQAGADFIEGWIIRANCDDYSLAGTVRDIDGTPIPSATLEVAFAGQRVATRGGSDGHFTLASAARVCEPKPSTVSVAIAADGYAESHRTLAFGARRFDFVLERPKPAIDFKALGTRP